MDKHSSSRQSLVLVAVLGAVVLGSLVFAWFADEPAPVPPADIGAPLPPPPPNVLLPPPSSEPLVDRDKYGRALFEISCARAKIEDTRLQQLAIEGVYARYGFDQASFLAAQQIMKEDPETLATLTARMWDCTRELADSLSPQHQPAPSDPEKPWHAGKFVDEQIEGSGLMGALRITVDDRGKVKVAFQGTREDKGFMIHLVGEVQEQSPTFVAIGSRGPHNARVAGRFNDGYVEGSIQGTIHQRGYRVNFKALDTSQPAKRSKTVVKEQALQDHDVRGIDLDNPAHLKLKVQADGTVLGALMGKREGKGFSVPMKGRITEDGVVEATGTRGPSTVRLSGRSVSDRIEGTLQGTVYRFDYNVSFTAK